MLLIYQYWKDKGSGVEFAMEVEERLAHHDVPEEGKERFILGQSI